MDNGWVKADEPFLSALWQLERSVADICEAIGAKKPDEKSGSRIDSPNNEKEHGTNA